LLFLSILEAYALLDKKTAACAVYQMFKSSSSIDAGTYRTMLVEQSRWEKSVKPRIDEILKHNQAKDDDELDLSYSDETELRQLNVLRLQQFILIAFSTLKANDMLITMFEHEDSMRRMGKDPRVEFEQARRAEEQERERMRARNPQPSNFVIRPDGSIVPLGPHFKPMPPSALGGSPLGPPAAAAGPASSLASSPAFSSSTPLDMSSSPLSLAASAAASSALGGGVVATYDPSTAFTQRRDLQGGIFHPRQTWTISLEEEQEREAEKQLARIAREKEFEEEERFVCIRFFFALSVFFPLSLSLSLALPLLSLSLSLSPRRRPKPPPDSDVADELERKEKQEWDEWKDDNPAGSGNRG
jgi:hypothetical protein